MTKLIALLMCLALLFTGGCAKRSEPVALGIARHPQPQTFARVMKGSSLPEPWLDGEAQSIDFRSYDLTNADLTAVPSLFEADFDSVTKWPASLPEGFDPEQLMELGKNPGLNVRALHERGITGKGVSIAIIDQTLLVDHVEYVDRLRHYEEMDNGGALSAQMHGAAVASIAVGKSVGVAPEANLYYVGHNFVDRDFSHLAECVDRVVVINRSLPKGQKIRVLTIQIGWGADSKGAVEMQQAVNRAINEGIFVITSSLESYSSLAFHGLGRDPLGDPDNPGCYSPGGFYAKTYAKVGFAGFKPGSRLLVPMDSRCVACQSGVNDYAFYRYGGWSWCMPYLAGLYALACQVKPDVTPEEFWQAGLDTGDQTTIRASDGTSRYFGVIVNPGKLIDRLSGD